MEFFTAISVFCLTLAITLAVFFGFSWLLWTAYCFVLGNVWPDGPHAVVTPGFWLFFVACFLISGLVRLVRRA